ncbi:hypothetical protein HYDPIDRAFT_95658 [Hydnomerulius pinastri MD-312]|uniref:DDE Tnp4 domain-containing protein n=1 Tax=Hydnomerulius pinastri MD-312 TaxID=994086 RepID=A0A0C9V896_9AGAM|nr:hypothetical protein HYDPIDRAFT_95769 [Hydnomerulius pinastri MD-312]KIJ61909.1 hypothetical protein HYDPIDRAFT_95658 [Hydnomerulius pinastri MD-312]
MPAQSERQQTANVLLQAYLASIVAESRAHADPPTSSSSGSSDSDDSSSSSEDELLAASGMMLRALGSLYSRRYLAERQPINKSGKNLLLLLTDWKFSRPEIFCAHVRMTPECFDLLLAALQTDPVFHNNSNLPQMPVDMQLAIALYRFGHYGNAISTTMVGLWAGIGFGTVRLITNRVLTALCRQEFRRAAIYWPTGVEREEAKQWVEENSCPAWRDGWVMVDGTLIPLYARPGYFGNTWYDHKSNYSLNLQVMSTPDLQIIDYSVGLPGSQHDSTAFAETRVSQEHDVLLAEDEWIFADSAYPLHAWCQAPYKKYVIVLNQMNL